MSKLRVTVTPIERIERHPNADALELAHVLGWQLVVKKGAHQAGDLVVYFPPDTVLPEEVSDRFGVTKYLAKGRIRCARLRGEPSFGLAVKPDDPTWEVGRDVALHYGATKWEPPLRPSAGDADTPHPLFVEYTEIENLRNYPDLFAEGEEVEVTEKLHGTSCRVGLIEGVEMAGSHRLRRKRPAEEELHRNTYWYPWSIPGVRDLLGELGTSHRQVILFGEVFGPGIQSLHYGLKNAIAFRAFDLMLDFRYVDADEFKALCDSHNIPRVPVLAGSLPFSLPTIRSLSGGPTSLMDKAAHIREGVVVRPVRERRDPKLGRVILKYLSDEYLLADKSDYQEA